MCLLRWAYCRGDSRLPAECRGNTGEADDAEPESLDSGPQVLLNLLRVWKFMMGLLLREVGRSGSREGGCCVWVWCFFGGWGRGGSGSRDRGGVRWGCCWGRGIGVRVGRGLLYLGVVFWGGREGGEVGVGAGEVGDGVVAVGGRVD